ncbi:MAG: four helix bundle protein [Saprospiraceae bacterium]|uniref:Four helix bundle protein n=1 Tax=Candidatus Opimibacter skivensis TaxID=2982028 RepID=A0A9D7XP09_9BACT|nr:four helix bundle protein [Candidatus Opimibacter skivensis]
MKQEEFNELFRQRTKKLALTIIKITSPLKYSDALGVIRKQLIRASTSVASNFRAVCRSRSDREKFSKLCIVVEEADETPFWIEMIIAGEFLAKEEMSDIEQEADEILKVMSAYKKRLYDDLNKSPDHLIT